MIIAQNNIIKGKHQLPILLDFGYKKTKKQKPVVIFAHGFKGFKDWGHFNLMMNHFIENNFVFVKFNFSHNGGSIQQPIDFPDLEAFGNNNYTKELDDLKTVTDWVINNQQIPKEEVNTNQIYLIGHSRGGGISIIAANEDSRIKKLVTWAAVADFEARLPHDLSQWKKEGVLYIENGRTKQQMPMYYQFVEDFLNHQKRLTIKNAESTLAIPHLIVHGTNDEAVNVSEAKQLAKWNTSAELFLIENANHVFGASHPYLYQEFPNDFKLVVDKTIEFFNIN